MRRRAFLGALGAATLVGAARGAPAAQAQPIRVRRLTWAGIQLAHGDQTLLIDPLLTPAAWQPSWTAPVIPLEIATPQVTMLVTHVHPDHFDPTGLRNSLRDRAGIVCLAAKAPLIASYGFRTYGLAYYEPMAIGTFSVVAVPAADGNGEEQVSWIVRAGNRRFIHCGDTMWHGHWWKIGREFGPFDLAFLPINGAKLLVRQPYVDVPATMTPDQAVAAAVVLRAQAVCPIHYGFNDPQRYIEHPDALEAFRASAAARGIAPRVLAPGDWLELSS